jgi:hypothetical protein
VVAGSKEHPDACGARGASPTAPPSQGCQPRAESALTLMVRGALRCGYIGRSAAAASIEPASWLRDVIPSLGNSR